jgi:hypothetical protein
MVVVVWYIVYLGNMNYLKLSRQNVHVEHLTRQLLVVAVDMMLMT